MPYQVNIYAELLNPVDARNQAVVTRYAAGGWSSSGNVAAGQGPRGPAADDDPRGTPGYAVYQLVTAQPASTTTNTPAGVPPLQDPANTLGNPDYNLPVNTTNIIKGSNGTPMVVTDWNGTNNNGTGIPSRQPLRWPHPVNGAFNSLRQSDQGFLVVRTNATYNAQPKVSIPTTRT